MVLNAAVQMLREADELKLTISKFKSGTSMLQERSLWATQQQLQKIYQKVLVLDLDYALDKKVEQDLWNIGFKQQIEALQAISKDKKNTLRSKGQAMLSWVLQAAAGFYLCLLHQICTTLQLDLPFRRRASLLGWVEGWGAGGGAGAGVRGVGGALPAPEAARYITQHCLVHLGDLARYQHQLRLAHTFYRHALVVSVHSGQPYNQLALVSWRRARSLPALYWHVRSLLVRAPFPPAPGNLARTLRAAAMSPLTDRSALPVLGVPRGGSPAPRAPCPAPAPPARLDAHSYLADLIRALHYIHTGDELDKAEALVKSLNSSLTTLIATDSFESSTLIKMSVVVIWLVHSTTEDLTLVGQAATGAERRQTAGALALAAGALLALLLPACAAPHARTRALPALKVWLEWTVSHAVVLESAEWRAHAALWPALAHTLTHLATDAERGDKYATVPLPEDEELNGFLPLEGYLSQLQFPNHGAWDTYGASVPVSPTQHAQSPLQLCASLSQEAELQRRVRAHRLVQLGVQLAHLTPQLLSYTWEDEVVRFTAAAAGGAHLSAALEQLAAAGAARGERGGDGEGDTHSEDDSDEDAPSLKPPIVISEADFRERVREKRAGILKPQGSLERAREERALCTQDEQDGGVTFESQEECGEEGRSDDKRERRARVNIAMAAIMRKQEETNKQVTFVTPPPVADLAVDTEKPKVIQPKPMKSLADLPLGRKTGGILSLKDKSGYPHLVNTEPEKKEKEEKKEQKPSEPPQAQPYQAKRQDLPPSPTWPPSAAPAFNGPRMSFQKNYQLQNAGGNYQNPGGYQPAAHGAGIRLPVVNPKEIDVRTAALQKQNSRQDLFQDGHKFHNYQVSGDKKNFLNDLPPRFANRYRHWQVAQETQYGDNKFRDDGPKPPIGATFDQQPRSGWNGPPPEPYRAEPAPRWTADDPPPSFEYSMAPNYFGPQASNNMQNPYASVQSFNPMSSSLGRNPEPASQYSLPSTVGQPMRTLQSVVTSPNFNSSLNSFGSYLSSVPYDAGMYPQFTNMYRPLQPPRSDRDLAALQGAGLLHNAHRITYTDVGNNADDNNMTEHSKMSESLREAGAGAGAGAGSTYSLFSGASAPPALPAPAAPWAARRTAHTTQSLWSGPGPSPLERLLEQQKQLSHPPHPAAPPH